MEKESNNGSEKKLLRRTCAGNASNSNSDSEYTYVDGRTARLIPVKQVGILMGCTEFSIPLCREVSSCFVLGVPLPCLGSS